MCNHVCALSCTKTAKISIFDLEDSYFPPFRKMVEAGGAGYMCSYPALSAFSDINLTQPFQLFGEPVLSQPSCGSKFLKWVMRDVWGFRGFVESDCGAVQQTRTTHHFTDTEPEAVAAALNFG